MQWLTWDQDIAAGSDLLIDFNDDAEKRRPRPHRSALNITHDGGDLRTFGITPLISKGAKHFPFLPTPLR